MPTCRATICTGAGSTHTWRASERRLHFDSPTCTRVNSDSSVNDGYCFRLFNVDTSPSTYFSPFPSRTLPRSTRTMTDSGQLRSSISLLGKPCRIFTFAKHVSFEHSTGIPCPVISSRRDGNINKRTKTQKFLDARSSISQSASTCLCSGAPRPVGDLAGAATFLSNRTYRYRPLYPARCRKLLAMIAESNYIFESTFVLGKTESFDIHIL